ncbi:MAG: AAA family ATPase [Bacteroidales bacterium]
MTRPKSTLKNPFVTVGYYGPVYFCDREKETSQLKKNMLNGNSTALISVRRIGKTGLIHHLLNHIPAGWKGIYVDIQETENLNQFLNKISTSVIQSFSEKSKPGQKIWQFIKSLRPVVSFDTLTGAPQATFEVKRHEAESNIHAILLFLEKQNSRILLAIDEFQQILNYPEKNTDAWLRSKIQELNNLFFIFSGSSQHLMKDLFANPQRPFFRSTHLLKLEKLNKTAYKNFIIKMFSKYNKEIEGQIAEKILEWTEIHTFYVQQLCNRIFSSTVKKVTDESWKEQAYYLLKEQEPIFFSYRSMLTRGQWNLLKAISREHKVYHPSSKDFLSKHHLSTSASVLRSLRSLTEYDLIYSDFDENGKVYYDVYDVYFKRWIQDKQK